MKQFRVLRVEETPVTAARAVEPVAQEAIRVMPPPTTVTDDVDYWRKMAIQTAERLSIAENQAKDLRTAADEARARFGKYKDRLDKAQARVNELQVEVVRLSGALDQSRDKLARQDVLSREVHAFRQSILDGHIWNVFAELAVSPPSAGEEKGK